MTPGEETATGIGLTALGIGLAPFTFGLSTLIPVVFGATREKRAQEAAGRAAMEWARGERDIAEYNAKVAGIRAADARARGEWEARQIHMGRDLLIGSQRAGFAAQNIDVGIGSPVDVNADTAFLAELDAQMALQNAAREAWGYEVDAYNFRAQGQQALKQGAQTQRGYQYAGQSAVLGAVASGTSLLANRYGWGSGNYWSKSSTGAARSGPAAENFRADGSPVYT